MAPSLSKRHHPHQDTPLLPGGKQTDNAGDNAMNYLSIIDKYYKKGALRDLLIEHSEAVTRRALAIAAAHPELNIDARFVEEAAMLHDIGIISCDAPGICCHGQEPYIRHGIIGARMMRAEGYPKHARVCERHTGAGISREEIIRQKLPLPLQSFLPETIEEQLICYADKFYSKSKPHRVKTVEQAEHSLMKFGNDGVERFRRWAAMFE